jgi:hypothetical protein
VRTPSASRARPPATPRALRAWRRTGLIFGVPAGVLVVAAVVVRLAVGRDGPWYPALALPDVLGGLLAVVFLRRVWSEPGHPATAWSRRGQGLATAFVNLWGLGVLLKLVEHWVAVPEWFRSAVALAAAGALVAAVAVALRERPSYARS